MQVERQRLAPSGSQRGDERVQTWQIAGDALITVGTRC